MNWDPLTIGALGLIVLNCLVTLRVFLLKSATGIQKLTQIAIIWCLPLLGALLIYFFHRSDNEPKGPAKPPFGGGGHDGMPGGVQ